MNMTTPTNEEVRRQFEAGVNQWPNYSERTLARDGRYPDYYGNPVVQGAWEGFKLALSSPAVVALVEADRLIDKCDAALESHRESNVYDEAWAATQLEIHRTRDLAVKRRAEALVRIAPFTTGAGHVE